MASVQIICNPTAGRGRAGRLLPEIQATLRALGVEADVVTTRAAHEATVLATQAVQAGFELIVAVGGDGTLQEVAQGILDAQSVLGGTGHAARLGIIPVGTGNDFIKTLAIPADWRSTCSRIVAGNTRRVDVGRVNNRIFLNTVGIGFDAQVGIEARKIHWLRGQLVYLAALARNMLLSYRTPSVSIDLGDTQIQQSMTLLTIGNGRCTGGGFWMTPTAEVDDGLFDICLMRGVSKAQMLALIPKVLKGTHIMESSVQMIRARTITITSDDPLPVHADGEILYTDAHRLEVVMLPSALDVVV